MKTASKLWIGIAILIIISPLGLLFPVHFKAGTAWGEWEIKEVKEFVGYIPQGLQRFSSLWSAPIPDYAFKGWQEKELWQLSFAYIISAIAGITVTVFVILILARILLKRKK